MYFLRGKLPWQDLNADTKLDKYERIADKKISTPIEVLCAEFPDEFSTYLKYCRSLKFEEKPDYVWIKRLFKDCFNRCNY